MDAKRYTHLDQAYAFDFLQVFGDLQNAEVGQKRAA